MCADGWRLCAVPTRLGTWLIDHGYGDVESHLHPRRCHVRPVGAGHPSGQGKAASPGALRRHRRIKHPDIHRTLWAARDRRTTTNTLACQGTVVQDSRVRVIVAAMSLVTVMASGAF